jgi:hypothetical protein
LSSDEIKEARVIVVEQPERAEPGDEKTGATGLTTRWNRKYDGFSRRLPPSPAGKVGCKNLAQLSNDPRSG